MNIKRAVFMAVVALAVAAMAIPVIGLRVAASGSAVPARPVGPTVNAAGLTQPAPTVSSGQKTVRLSNGQVMEEPVGPNDYPRGEISPETRAALGIRHVADPAKAAEKIAARIKSRTGTGGQMQIQSGEPLNMNAGAALSDALIFTEGGRDTQFSEVALLGDWDGREDCVADHSGKVDDFSGVEVEIDQTLTRAAISEHTIANGFAEDIFYYGDSVGNLWVAASTNLNQATPTPQIVQINLPSVLNAFGTLNSDDQITITGITVNPVADLGSFARVNGAFASFNGLTGEIVYVSFFDSESGLRLLANGTPIRSGVLAFPVADIVSAAPAPPGILSTAGFPVQVGGAFGVAFSVFSNIAGVACDDDGSIYFQQVDLVQFTGANIVKITGVDQPLGACGMEDGAGAPSRSKSPHPFLASGFQDRSLATSGFFILTTLNPLNGQYGTASGPANQVNVATNYSGTSTLWGDIVAINTGPCNVLYAAVSPSFVAPGDPTQGLFPAPSAYGSAGTPSMVISFADCSGSSAACSLPHDPITGLPIAGIGIPVADGIADRANASVTTVIPGVNNFRIFVLGNGPDIRPAAGATAIVPGTLGSVLKIDMQIDYAEQSGIAVSLEGTVFVVSGGEPAGVGKSPSPMVGEILCFEDKCPADRRADFVDLRSTGSLPNPPADSNVGDGVSDRFDHIFWQAPIDQITLTPTGVSGLNFGFLLYTNRLRTADRTPELPNGGTQGDDATTPSAVIFEQFDPSHQVAGGDDQVFPFTGDDDDGGGSPPLAGPLSGGFEFLFANPLGDVFQVGAACGVGNGVWNGFFLNSNGNITFGAGDTQNIGNVLSFRAGLPKIAPAWCDLNPGSRAAGFLNTFPVQALGFANINAFEVRWINVPEFGFECCGSSNTFSVTLYDDGTGVDENANQPLNPANPIGNNAVAFDLLEGATANRWTTVTVPGQPTIVVGCPPRRDGTGIFAFEYCRMDLLGTADNPVVVGFSIGHQNALNPPGLCETNLSVAAAAAETAFGVLPGGQTAAVGCNCCIGEGTEPSIFELFNEGTGPSIGSGGEITFAKPDFDLRFEGNDAALCTSSRQREANRGHVCFYGTTCQLPPNPSCLVVFPNAPVTVAPNQPAVGSAAAATPNGAGQKIASPTAGIINALCAVTLNTIGCGFFPNEVTTICQGFESETGVPLQRPGKTVSTAQTLNCDTNGDGVPDLAIPLTQVTPINCNLVRGTAAVTANLPGSAFPLTCCGGFATLTTTTTFTAGNNNIFNLLPSGGFTRSTTCTLDLGPRAPVVLSATPSAEACNGLEDLLISGACFILPNGTANVTSVFLQNTTTGAIASPCAPFTIVNANLIDVNFCFTSAQAGQKWLVFVTGPNGTSRNLTTDPVAGCPTGNEQGVTVTFACNAPGTPNTGGTPVIATVTGCHLDRQDNGTFFLDVTGTNIKDGATATVGGVTPKKIKVVAVEPGTSNPTTLRLLKKVCNGLPGNVIITNTVPNGGPSAPFNCTERCPSN